GAGRSQNQAAGGARSSQAGVRVLVDADRAAGVEGQRAEVHAIQRLTADGNRRAAEAGVVADEQAGAGGVGDCAGRSQNQAVGGARSRQAGVRILGDADGPARVEGQRAEVDAVARLVAQIDRSAAEAGVVADKQAGAGEIGDGAGGSENQAVGSA